MAPKDPVGYVPPNYERLDRVMRTNNPALNIEPFVNCVRGQAYSSILAREAAVREAQRVAGQPAVGAGFGSINPGEYCALNLQALGDMNQLHLPLNFIVERVFGAGQANPRLTIATINEQVETARRTHAAPASKEALVLMRLQDSITADINDPNRVSKPRPQMAFPESQLESVRQAGGRVNISDWMVSYAGFTEAFTSRSVDYRRSPSTSPGTFSRVVNWCAENLTGGDTPQCHGVGLVLGTSARIGRIEAFPRVPYTTPTTQNPTSAERIQFDRVTQIEPPLSTPPVQRAANDNGIRLPARAALKQ